MLKISSNIKEVQKELKNMQKSIDKNMSRAVNKGLAKCRTEITREVREVYTKVRAVDIRKSIKLKKATKINGGEVIIGNNLTPISDGILRTKKHTKSGKIKVNIKNNTTKTLSMNGKYKPFVMKLKSGKTIVARRKTDEKYPVQQLKTLSIPHMTRNLQVSDQIKTKVAKIIDKEFIRLMNLGDKIK